MGTCSTAKICVWCGGWFGYTFTAIEDGERHGGDGHEGKREGASPDEVDRDRREGEEPRVPGVDEGVLFRHRMSQKGRDLAQEPAEDGQEKDHGDIGSLLAAGVFVSGGRQQLAPDALRRDLGELVVELLGVTHPVDGHDEGLLDAHPAPGELVDAVAEVRLELIHVMRAERSGRLDVLTPLPDLRFEVKHFPLPPSRARRGAGERRGRRPTAP